MQWTIAEKCVGFEINEFEFVAVNSPYYDENT